jgi:hypothetical protein
MQSPCLGLEMIRQQSPRSLEPGSILDHTT